MAVSSATAWTDNTAVVASAIPTRVKAIKIRPNPDSTGISYLQLYDAVSATPGSTTPNEVIYIPGANIAGRAVEYAYNINGKWHNTGLCWFVSTTYNGGTAATTNAPSIVDIHYSLGGG